MFNISYHKFRVSQPILSTCYDKFVMIENRILFSGDWIEKPFNTLNKYAIIRCGNLSVLYKGNKLFIGKVDFSQLITNMALEILTYIVITVMLFKWWLHL